MPDPRLEAALACADTFYDQMFRTWPGAVTERRATYTLSYSGDVRLTGANHLWPHTPDALTAEALHTAERFFAPYNAAWSVIYTDTYMPHTADFLADQGYTARWSSPLMVLDTPPHRPPINPAVRVVRAATPRHIEHVRQVMTEAFATNSSINHRVARPEHLPAEDVVHYLVYSGDEPAACATLSLCDGMGGVWNVGTRYRFRRRRCATTIMLALLDDLRARGIPASMLMASSAGYPLYEQLGYRPVGITCYMGPPFYAPRRDF
ncbi:MAG: GNAT family N-acetyltransferase [Chloroflexi bacterium]|nr:GNAT family N-acetyltransferase [Chloroflexota bacterium]